MIPSRTPILGILNETDSPHQMSVVAVWAKQGGYRWCFVAPRANHPGPKDYLNPESFTPIADFGIAASMTPDGRLALHQLTISIARYDDGRARHWQGSQGCTLDMHRHAAGQVVEAVRLDFEARREAREAS